ncbi:TIGR04086 family membrane protein [Alicyclobacillus tolerans]|uniref:Membrane protein (TIGR04086 family) n=1 Tax=Alicyclobacillus tolerans TaxID=90970 RepID=A0ABT9LSM6_9BACL|nr:TIGR04086 family membrane protein [Alicyclobacillus montanus]MDP9727267.1 putative membrane protein (TIGR04086 family) [Alicyclobacillus tengchongensis]
MNDLPAFNAWEPSDQKTYPVLLGISVAIVLSIAGILISLWLAESYEWDDGMMITSSYIVHALATVCGAYAASRHTVSKPGWYVGGMTGFFFSLIMTGIGFWSFHTFTLDAGGVLRILLMTLAGSFVGIIGAHRHLEKY